MNNDQLDDALSVYAKEEAVSAVLLSYQKANLDIYITAIYDGCVLGNNVAPSGTFPVQRVEGTQIVNDQIEYITLKYRMNINNSPIFKEKTAECTLSFSGTFRNTIVPYINIVSISLIDQPGFQISFPYLGLLQEETEEGPKKAENKKEKPIHKLKKKSFLRIVK